MTVHLLKKVVLGVAMLFCETTMCYAQNTEEELNLKYWTMRERFRRYFVSIGKEAGQSIPASKKQSSNIVGTNRCSNLYSLSSGTMSWGDATGYISDYICTLATEYALLMQEGKSTTATLNELYYALNAIDRLDGVAENTFDPSKPISYNGFFLRDDVRQPTLNNWSNQYSTVNIGGPNSTGSSDEGLNYRCFNSDRDKNFNNEAPGNSSTNEPSFDQIVTIFQGFKFVKQYVPNVYVKPTAQDVGFNIIDKMQSITSNIMEYMSGAERTLLKADHKSEFIYNQINPSLIFSQLALVNNLIIYSSDCADNDVRSNWVLMNPITNRKVGSSSNDTKNQDIRPFAWVLAKIGEQLTGNTYTDRQIHHKVVDQLGDGHACLDFHDYHIPLSYMKTHLWDVLEQMPSIDDDYVINYKAPSIQTKPISFVIKNKSESVSIGSLARNVYMLEVMAAISGTWSHANVNKFAGQYHHENIDLIYACLNGGAPRESQQHYIDLLSKLSCDGPHNYGPGNFTSFWNNGNSFEHPTYDNIDTESFNYGEFNANDWMWLYNMYRLKFNDTQFPSYNDVSCNCKKNTVIEQNYNASTFHLTNSIYINRVFRDYLKLGISIKEYSTQKLIIDNKILENRTELIICKSDVFVQNNGILRNPLAFPASDSIKIVARGGSSIIVQSNGTFDVGQNAKVVIQKGGKLISNGTNSKIIVRNGSKLIIEPDALLELNTGSSLTVENGGQVIVSPKGIATLNNGSKLIVENGGLVIIKTNLSNPNANDNAVLTYNSGAEIQLKGDNAVLELNGRLHIGNNAIFKITYPGSNSGYIKFNRGNGAWWDNWAPNNAHITCGTNAKISLIGQSKTDKMIDITQMNVAIPANLVQIGITNCLIEFNASSARLETDRPVIISNSTFKGNPAFITTTRGLLLFGQNTCVISGCDFKDLGTGLAGALFYSGTKLKGVTGCNFTNCGYGIHAIGGGVTINGNNFTNVEGGVVSLDATLNSGLLGNTFNINSQFSPSYPSTAICASGPNVEFFIKQNVINNHDYALSPATTTFKLRCNDLQNNRMGVIATNNSIINMSDLLGGGFNNANNCDQFAWFIEAKIIEADYGFNNFKITNSVPCNWVPQSGKVPNIIPGYLNCPTIMEGSLTSFHTELLGINETYAEQNFWRALSSPTDVVEDRQNKVRKINFPSGQLDSASIITGNVLTNYDGVTCPLNRGTGGEGERVHPLDDNSNSAMISTASFPNKSLQNAVKFSLAKMDNLENVASVNTAADLFTEVLKANYNSKIKSSANNYLLDLSYQKLFTCVTQLLEWQKDNDADLTHMPAKLKGRLNDMHAICNLRSGRVDVSKKSYKEDIDLIMLDKAILYRISDDRQNAIATINTIIAGSPKAEHMPMYENFKCMWSIEDNAIKGIISTDEALLQMNSCQTAYNRLAKRSTQNTKKINTEKESEVSYAPKYAIAVYPNPTNGNLSVTYSLAEFKTITMELFNVQGKKMAAYNLNPEERVFNIDDLNLVNGVYFYHIKGDNTMLMNKKIVVVK